MCAHTCTKMVHCGILFSRIAGFVGQYRRVCTMVAEKTLVFALLYHTIPVSAPESLPRWSVSKLVDIMQRKCLPKWLSDNKLISQHWLIQMHACYIPVCIHKAVHVNKIYQSTMQILICQHFASIAWLMGPVLLTWFNLNTSMNKYHIPSNVSYEIMYPFPNFNGCAVVVWEWISHFNPLIMIVVIPYLRRGWS